MSSTDDAESGGFLRKRLPGPCGRHLKVGDLFKIIVPASWVLIVFMAVLAYLISPMLRNESPRWGTAALVGFSGIPGVGASLAVFQFLRYDSMYTIQGVEEKRRRNSRLRMHCIVSSAIVVIALCGALFFGTVGDSLGVCAHTTCGADVSWCIISLLASAVWGLCLLLALRIRNTNTVSSEVVENMDSIAEIRASV